MKFYWHTTTPKCLHAVSGCICAVTANLRQCGPQSLKYLLSGPLQGKFAWARGTFMEIAIRFHVVLTEQLALFQELHIRLFKFNHQSKAKVAAAIPSTSQNCSTEK